MKTSAEVHVDKKILSDVKRVNGKFDILCTMANKLTAEDKRALTPLQQFHSTGSKNKLGELVDRSLQNLL